jgi:hypothetical protein
MTFVIKYRPNNRFTNLTFRGLDAINIGLNPKIYKQESDAQRDLKRIGEAINHNLQLALRISYGASCHTNPNSTRKYKGWKNKNEFLTEKSNRLKKEVENMKPEDFYIEEYDQK